MPAGIMIPMIVGSGASLIGGHLASRTANRVAKAQAEAAASAAGLFDGATGGALDVLRRSYEASQAAYQPALALGTQALTSLADLARVGAGPPPPSFVAPNRPVPGPFVGPTAETFTADPGYAFRLREGQRALENSAAARGTLSHANTFRALMDLGQQMAAQEFQNVWAREAQKYGLNLGAQQQEFEQALSAHNANLASWGAGEDQRARTFGHLAALAGLGADAARATSAQAMNFGQLASNVLLDSAARRGEWLLDAANARAAGQVAGANAWQAALGQIGQNATTAALWQSLQSPRGTRPPPPSPGAPLSTLPGATSLFLPDHWRPRSTPSLFRGTSLFPSSLFRGASLFPST